jgi:hypothetical protein
VQIVVVIDDAYFLLWSRVQSPAMCFGRRAPEASGSSVGLHSRWDYQFQILLLLISVAYYFVIVVCSYVSSFHFLIVAAWSPCRWALKGNFSMFVDLWWPYVHVSSICIALLFIVCFLYLYCSCYHIFICLKLMCNWQIEAHGYGRSPLEVIEISWIW